MALVRLTVNYNIAGNAEIASNSFWFRTPGFVVQTDADALAPRLAELWNDTSSAYVTGTTMRNARLDVVSETTGLVITGFDVAVPTTSAGGGTNALPPQCAVVASFRTGTAGPSGRGRVYLPPVSTTQLASNGRLSTGTRTQLLTGVHQFLNDIKNTGPSWIPIVWSRSAKADRDILSVSVGDVVDTQRGRRNRLQESRVQQALT